MAGLSESTIQVQWNPVYNDKYEQMFYIEYRKLGSDVWNIVPIPSNAKLAKSYTLTHTLNGLQEGTLFEVRMYAENQYNRCSYLDLQTIRTSYKGTTFI